MTRGEERVVGGRAHRDAEPRADRGRPAPSPSSATATPRIASCSRPTRSPCQTQGARHGHVVAPVVVAPDESDGVLEDEGHADRGDGQGERPAVAHGAERDAVHRPRDGAVTASANSHAHPIRHPAPWFTREGREGADGEIRADGEVRKAQELPQEREGDGGQRQDAAGHEPVEEVLRDRRHPGPAVRD